MCEVDGGAASNLDFRLLLASYSIPPLSLSLSLSLPSLFFVLPQQFSSSFSASPDDAHCVRIARAQAGAGRATDGRARGARKEEGAEQIRPPREKLRLKLPGIYSTLSAALPLPAATDGQGARRSPPSHLPNLVNKVTPFKAISFDQMKA